VNIKELFGKKLKEIRLKLDLTQEELAEKIGISSKSLSQIELGNNFVSAETLTEICKALNISPKILFDFDYLKIKKSDAITDITNKLKNNPNLVKIIHKIVSALA